jgi:hypothetical protein
VMAIFLSRRKRARDGAAGRRPARAHRGRFSEGARAADHVRHIGVRESLDRRGDPHFR